MQLRLSEARRNRSVLDTQILVYSCLLSGDGMNKTSEGRVQLLVQDDGFARWHSGHFCDHGFWVGCQCYEHGRLACSGSRKVANDEATGGSGCGTSGKCKRRGREEVPVALGRLACLVW